MAADGPSVTDTGHVLLAVMDTACTTLSQVAKMAARTHIFLVLHYYTLQWLVATLHG